MVIGVSNNYERGKEIIKEYFESSGYKYYDLDKIGYTNLVFNEDSNIILDYEDLLEHPDLLNKCQYIINVNENSTLNTFSGARPDIMQMNKSPELNKYHTEINLFEEGWKTNLIDKINFCFENKEKVSVIVPVYNVQRYLKKCVNSILNQSYQNIEILLIDDGSKDNSGKICDDYAKKYSRIKVIHKRNGGLSAARNTGIDASTGDYLVFVDSDDYIDNNYVEIMLKAILDNNADISECGIFVHNKNGIINDCTPKLKFFNINNYKLDLLNYYADGNIIIASWNKMYRKDAIKDLYFDSNVFKEDSDYTFKLCDRGLSFIQVGIPLYHYVKKEQNSLTGCKFDNRFFNLASWAENCSQKIRSYGVSYFDAADKILYNSYVHIIKYYLRDYKKGFSVFKYNNEIKEIVNKLVKLIIRTNDVSKYRFLENVISIIKYMLKENIINYEDLYKEKIPVIGIIWNSLGEEYRNNITKYLQNNGDIASVTNVDLKNNYERFIRDIYIENKELEGVSYLKYISLIDRYKSNEISIIKMDIEVCLYEYTNNIKGFQFESLANIKRTIRENYKNKIYGYIYDNIFHMTMNMDEYVLTDNVIRKYVDTYGK